MDYAALSAPFDVTYTERLGGAVVTYVTGEQVISRMNDVLGPSGWSFTVKEHGLHADSDSIWVLGRLETSTPNGTVREQFGAAQIKRSRDKGTPLDLSNDMKAAATDALKKCAMGIGVALYLSQKPAPPVSQPARQQTRSTAARVTAVSPPAEVFCTLCGAEVVPAEYAGEPWPVERILRLSTGHYQTNLCFDCLRMRSESKEADA